jgi:tRNA1(Val) A37 N6-methylase TrmN6
VEIQERIYDMAFRSIQYNGLEHRLSVIRGDLNDMPNVLGNAGFDVVTCNPPYFPTPSETEYNENPHLAIARHEIYCTLEDVVRVSSTLVRHGGKVAFVHRPERLLDIVTLMRQYKIEPKRMRLVYPKAGKEANTLLVEGTKYGKAGLKILPPLYVYKENNEYTEEMLDILYGER